MSHFILLFCVLFGGFLAWAWWIKAHTGDDFDALRIIFDPVFQRESSAQMAETRRQAFQRFQMNNVAYGMNTQQQFIRPKASQFPELDWGLLKAMEERRELVNCWAEAIIDNQVINVGFDIPKNVQDKIIIGTYLTPEERAKYFD